MTSEQLLEIIAKLELERLRLNTQLEKAQCNAKFWQDMYLDREAGTNDMCDMRTDD